jgi:hypothetical protein
MIAEMSMQMTFCLFFFLRVAVSKLLPLADVGWVAVDAEHVPGTLLEQSAHAA